MEEQTCSVLGLQTRLLCAGSGPALVLLHALGENATDWQWIVPTLAQKYRVYAPDLPSVGPWRGADADYSPAFFGQFAAALLDTLDLDRATLVGNSLGGLTAMKLALGTPARVSSLVLVASGGLGRSISPALRSITPPGVGEASIAWGKTPLGAMQRAWGRAALLFAYPSRTPRPWIMEQYRLAQQPGFLQATLATLRVQVDLYGQREVLLDQLSHLRMPTLVVWGDHDRVVPQSQAQAAVERLPAGRLATMAGVGHLPHIEQPDEFVSLLDRFVAERI